MFDDQVIKMLLEGIRDTVYMTVVSTFVGYVLGLPMGVILTVTDKDGIKPNAAVYRVLDVICNIVRSIPFLILLILLIPFTRLIVGRSYGSTATIIPLVITAAPYIARMVESSLKEVDKGVIEAAKSMGASNVDIVFKVLLVEARTSLIMGATIALGTILGYSAMAGTVGGGGLGDIAVRSGYYDHYGNLNYYSVPDFPDHRNEDGWKTGQKKIKNHKERMRRKIMRKKLVAVLLTGVLAAAALTGCGEKAESTTQQDTQSAEATEEATEETQESAAGDEAAAEPVVIKIAASATPHAEILEKAKPILAEQGYDLEITVFDDYIQPGLVVESGEFDANYAVHVPFLETFNEEQGTHLVSAGGIHYEPFGIYPGTKATLDEVAEGDVIAIPNDTTNEARALLLLQDNGLLKLKDGVGLTATVNDIEENPNNLVFQELEAAQIARVKDEVAYVVLNGNYALEAGLSVAKDSIAYESSDSEAAKTYVNVIVVKEGNENSDAIKALVDVLKSDEIKQYINDTYDGAVIPFEG